MSSSHAETGGAFQVNNRLVLSIAIPMTLGFLTTPLLGLVGTGVVGQLGNPDALAGLAVGAMLFDLILGSFNFLRASTTGLTAQALGRGDAAEQQAIFFRAILLALLCGLVLIGLSPLIEKAGLALLGAHGDVARATSDYFSIRILSAPAALANYALLGFVLGRGKGALGLLLQSAINGINILLALYLGLRLGWGVAGVAWASLAGETGGAILGLALVFGGQLRGPRPAVKAVLALPEIKALFALNRDILIRTFVLIGSFAIMTRIGTGFGAVTLAANAVLMNFFLLSGYFLDGLANAAEQITGRAIGANYRPAFRRGLTLSLVWSLSLAGAASLFFLLAGPWLIALLTSSASVQDSANLYLPWAAVTALTGALAFVMDGVFIGATWSSDMRNRMLMSFIVYLAGLAVLVPLFGNHGLWAAMNLFLFARGILLAAILRRRVDQSFSAAQ